MPSLTLRTTNNVSPTSLTRLHCNLYTALLSTSDATYRPGINPTISHGICNGSNGSNSGKNLPSHHVNNMAKHRMQCTNGSDEMDLCYIVDVM